MDETEALCTRLGIMVNGELKCLGSLQHIKSRYGEGYTLLAKLTLGRLEAEKVQEFIDFILNSFENCTMKECRDGFINLHFNDNSVKMLASIFSLIESIKDKYAIEYYVVTQTKLEQIFINFASRQIDPMTRFLSKNCCSNLKCC
jgi:ATP-binding cassette subfamily A (ABC1) protein 3